MAFYKQAELPKKSKTDFLDVFSLISRIYANFIEKYPDAHIRKHGSDNSGNPKNEMWRAC